MRLCFGLVDKFWDTVYPELEDGDAQSRGAPLGFVGTKLEIPLKLVPVVEKATYGLLDYQQSREVWVTRIRPRPTKPRRNAPQLIKEGKLAPEVFDKAFEETPKKFYAQAEQDLDACLRYARRLKKMCDEKFGDDGPAFGPLQTSLETHAARDSRFSAEKAREGTRSGRSGARPRRAAGAEGEAGAEGGGAGADGRSDFAGDFVGACRTGSTRLSKVAEAAAFLRRREPNSPASYLMLRGLRWGELRAAIDLADPDAAGSSADGTSPAFEKAAAR